MNYSVVVVLLLCTLGRMTRLMNPYHLLAHHLPQQPQSLLCKPHHIPLSIASQPRVQLAGERAPRRRHSQRNIPPGSSQSCITITTHTEERVSRYSRRPILRGPSRRPSRAALADRIRRAQRLADVLCDPGDDLGCWAGVGGDGLLGPAGVGNAGLESV